MLILVIFVAFLSLSTCQFQGNMSVWRILILSLSKRFTCSALESWLDCKNWEILGAWLWDWRTLLHFQNLSETWIRRLQRNPCEVTLKWLGVIEWVIKWVRFLLCLDIAHLICDAHDVMFDMISQFHPTKPINHGNVVSKWTMYLISLEELLLVFKEKLWDQWLGTINRFNGAICELDLPAELQEAASIRIDLASMKPIKIHKFHGKYEKLKGKKKWNGISKYFYLKFLRSLERITWVCPQQHKPSESIASSINRKRISHSNFISWFT